MTVATFTPSKAADLRYGDAPTVDVALGGACVNPKQIRVGFVIDGSDDTTTLIQEQSVTPSTAGTVTTAAYEIHTDFSETPLQYVTRIAVGPSSGETSTPAAEQADFWNTAGGGTVNQSNTNDKAWTVSDEVTRYAADDHETDAAYGYTLYLDSGFVTEGVGVFDDSGYANASKLFKRDRDDGFEEHNNPYLRTWVEDAYGTALNNTAFTARVLDGVTAGVEDSQSITTDANGLINWNYRIARTDLAFNRYKLAGTDDPDSPNLSVAEADVYNADPNSILLVDANYPGKTFAGPYPAAGKSVEFVGRAYGGGASEPVESVSEVFGVNSETHVTGIWSGNSSETTDDANEAPTGTGGRNKNAGTGGFKWKTASEYDEGNGAIYSVTRTVARDVAGRDMDVSTSARRMRQRWGVWDDTAGGEHVAEEDAGIDGRLQGTYGYPTGFETIAQPVDVPAILYLWVALHDEDANILDAEWDMNGAGEDASLQPNATVTEQSSAEVGFTSSMQGNFGQFVQVLQFITVDPDLNFFVVAERLNTYPGDTVKITAEMIRLLPSQVDVGLEPDSALHLKIQQINLTGASSSVYDGPMTVIAGTSDQVYEYDFTIPEAASYSMLVTGFKDGSRPPDAGDLSIVGSAQNPNIDLVIDVLKSTDLDKPLQPGDTYSVRAYMVDDTDGTLKAADSSPAPTAAIVRSTASDTIEYLDSDGVTFKNAQTQGPVFYHTMTDINGDGVLWGVDFTVQAADFRDIVPNVRMTLDGVLYADGGFREVSAASSPTFDSVNFALSVGNPISFK